MADGPTIELEGVGKRYWQLKERAMLLRSILPFSRPERTERWALRDVELTIGPGETVGVIGRNGAGKTTMLRLMAGVTQPTEGVVKIRGRVAPLISVGVGFHHEMSGRENVLVNGLLLGLTTKEVEERFDRIVEFAELEEFIDTPVKFYSTGMFMRLGFAVAIHVEPQVLLVDEVLAVGDIAFQLKCYERMRALQRDGTTILLVSHSMHAVQLLCPRAILVDNGDVVFDGPAEETIARYHQVLAKVEGATAEAGGVTFLERSLESDGAPATVIQQDMDLIARCSVRFDRAVESPQVLFRVMSDDGTVAYGMQTALGERWRRFESGETASIEVRFQPRLGGGGTFRILTMITDWAGANVLGTDLGGSVFYVPPRLGVVGVADLNATIAVAGEVLSDHAPLLLDGTDRRGTRAVP
jgi:ABC-type polysaccharide/polyol phosphate transport system ATPase subunit